MIGILQVIAAIDAYIVPDAAVLVYNGIADVTAFADSQFRQSSFNGVLHFFNGFKIIRTHDIAAHHGCSMPNAAADADHTVLNAAGVDDAAFGNDGLFERGAADFSRRQHACAGVYGVAVV